MTDFIIMAAVFFCGSFVGFVFGAFMAAPRKRYVTRKLRNEILAYAKQYPDAHQADIAAWFDVNPGRVSEILNGKR